MKLKTQIPMSFIPFTALVLSSLACWVDLGLCEARSASFYRCWDCSVSQIRVGSVSIRRNRDIFLCIRLVSGGLPHRRYLRFSTDEFSPNHNDGDFIWVFDPGINGLTFSFKGIEFCDNVLSRPQSDDGDAPSIVLEIPGLMKGEFIVTNRRYVWRFKRHDSEPSQTTYQILYLLRLMRKAFRSFIYKMLAFYECMKKGLNRFILLLVSLSFGKQGYFHFFIEIVFNFLYLFQRLYLNGSMYHVNSYGII